MKRDLKYIENKAFFSHSKLVFSNYNCKIMKTHLCSAILPRKHLHSEREGIELNEHSRSPYYVFSFHYELNIGKPFFHREENLDLRSSSERFKLIYLSPKPCSFFFLIQQQSRFQLKIFIVIQIDVKRQATINNY